MKKIVYGSFILVLALLLILLYTSEKGKADLSDQLSEFEQNQSNLQ